jgi:gluconate 5-dehydrogenase
MSNPFSLEGRTALVTGSSQGIGFSLARGLAAAGARVILNGRDAAKLAAAQATLAGEGHRIEAVPFDVTTGPDVRAAIDRIEREVAPIDILVNNAGIQRRVPLQDFAEETWSELMRSNLDSAFLVGQAVARPMIARGRGKIINICSVQSALARPNIAPYAASKGALAMLTKGMCTDWAPFGLQVNGLAPGYFETELTRPLVDDEAFSTWLKGRTPARRWGKVEELNGAAVFLASAASDFVNGHILYVDGGITSCL